MRRAFTLIELLVVIVIIGIIAAMTTVALNGVRAKARDTKRIADIRNLQSALEIYKNDNGVYPTYATSGTALVANGQTYLAKVPTAPTNTGSDVYTYTSTTGGTSYSIAYNLEKGVENTGSGSLLALPGQIAIAAPAPFVCGNSITLEYKGASINYGTIPGAGNTCWLDRNLGASNAATSSTDALAYGDLFQWGRQADGHEIRTPLSSTISNTFSLDTPNDPRFVKVGNGDWRSDNNNNRWNANPMVNNPCPSGWKVPTQTQWQDQGITNAASAFSKLKLANAGYREESDGSIYYENTNGYYWSSSINGTLSYNLGLAVNSANSAYSNTRASGRSVRCLKDS